ncbi:MAG: DUF6913 domain-containing protein [Tenacibaculum sp.]
MIADLKIKSILKQYKYLINKQSVKYSELEKITSVAVILDNEALINVIASNLLNNFPLKKEAFTFLVYSKFFISQTCSTIVFSEKDIGFKASLKSHNLNKFVKYSFDLLINYTKESNIFINIITLQSQAKLKAGFAQIDDRLFDIVVYDSTFNEAILNQELKKYLVILNKI